jgi:hypothetical protein
MILQASLQASDELAFETCLKIKAGIGCGLTGFTGFTGCFLLRFFGRSSRNHSELLSLSLLRLDLLMIWASEIVGNFLESIQM